MARTAVVAVLHAIAILAVGGKRANLTLYHENVNGRVTDAVYVLAEVKYNNDTLYCGVCNASVCLACVYLVMVSSTHNYISSALLRSWSVCCLTLVPPPSLFLAQALAVQ